MPLVNDQNALFMHNRQISICNINFCHVTNYTTYLNMYRHIILVIGLVRRLERAFARTTR
ncbi:hypothetical protein HanPSC8_Chr02g0064461 [Helianthus annuus]|nr:hypothetical protein HanPSC8_Chr02g0064461 [Helianthus annuus]